MPKGVTILLLFYSLTVPSKVGKPQDSPSTVIVEEQHNTVSQCVSQQHSLTQG